MPTAARHRLLPLLAVPAVAALVVTGVWVAGGVITDDYRASMALTAAGSPSRAPPACSSPAVTARCACR